MQKLAFYFVSLFILFFACTQEPNTTTDTGNDGIKSTPIVPSSPASQPRNIPKPVPQAAAADLVYPKEYKEFGIPKFKNAKMENNVPLENAQGKYGRRIKLTCKGTYDEVIKFYDDALVKNGWKQNHNMDNTQDGDGLKYFSTNYVKDDFTFLLSVLDAETEDILVNQILKQN